MMSGSLGFAAVALLLQLPAVPNCPKIFLPTASASTRLYCAQLAANKQTADDLLEAIALVGELPDDHPLRPEINRYIEQWSSDILNIGEEKFQAGDLERAMEIAKRIPSGVAAYDLVEERLDRWQSIWSEAEEIYAEAERQLRLSNWNLAFREAVRLTSVGNQHWATFKHNELIDKIQIAREDSAKLDEAYRLSKSGNVDQILEAIEQAKKIAPESYAYKEAQDLIAESGEKLLEIAQNRLDRGNWQGVLEIADKLPDSIKSPKVKGDLTKLARAMSRAESGTVVGLEEAFASAQELSSDRPLYAQAQKLAQRWEREIEDVARLERARTFASSGLASDLRIAIAEAQQIPQGNPRYQEARGAIQDWTRRVEVIEDRPYLNRAAQMASLGGVASLQDAVREARQIAPGRALHGEAQDKISEWTREIQRQQDQPYLDRARALAGQGNLSQAVATAQQIQSGRVLYSEAQREIRSWQAELQGQQRMREAYEAAKPGTPEALSSAIRTARQVPTSASKRSEAVTAVNRWAYQILQMAQDRATYNIPEAIRMARFIPSGTEAYGTAQSQIQSWERSIAPPPPPVIELSPSPTVEPTDVEF